MIQRVQHPFSRFDIAERPSNLNDILHENFVYLWVLFAF